jgi:hypothetical protein
MRKPVTLAATAAALVACTLALAACGHPSTTSSTQSLPSLPTSPVANQPTPSTPGTPATPTTPVPTPSTRPSAPAPHFDSPEAAMRYLAAAYDRGDLAGLRPVTTPASRDALWEMRSEAVNLRLTSCDRNPNGSYTCQFTHDYPKSLHMQGHGASTMVASPAARPGWYMSELLDCG